MTADRNERARQCLSDIISSGISDDTLIGPNHAVEAMLAFADQERSQEAAERGGGENFLRPEVAAFAVLMERQLRANDHKPGWKDDLAMDLLPRLREETDELDEATVRLAKQIGWGDAALYLESARNNVAREAADVGNFAMMIADVSGVLLVAAPTPTDHDALVERLRPWLQHQVACRTQLRLGAKSCSCGLDKALTALRTGGGA